MEEVVGSNPTVAIDNTKRWLAQSVKRPSEDRETRVQVPDQRLEACDARDGSLTSEEWMDE